MMRRMMLALFFILLVATSAWPKFNADEQKYLDDHFKAIQDQVQALTTQLQTLNAQLVELRQNQAQFQAVIDNELRSLKELDQTVTSMQTGGEDNFSNLKTAITKFQKETQAEFKQLGVGSGAGPSPTMATAPGSTPPVLQCNVTDVKGDTLMLDMGSSSQGIHPGSRLKLYKQSDPNTQVGVIQIIEVIDAGNSRAQIVTVTPGVRPEFGDVVRLE